MEKFFPFTGTVSRIDFAARVFAFVIVTALVDPRGGDFAMVLFVVLSIALIAAFAGRLRDAGFSPWLSLIIFVPFLGWLVILVFMIWNGRRH